MTLRRSTDLGLHRRGTLMCWLLSAAISLSCQGRGAPGGPKGPIGVTSLPESLAASDSTFRCALGLTLELASGDAIRNAKLCVGQRSDTSYALGYVDDHRLVYRVRTWQVPDAAVDSVVAAMRLRLDHEHGAGRECPKAEIERYWTSQSGVILLSVDRPDLPRLRASVSVAEEARRPAC